VGEGTTGHRAVGATGEPRRDHGAPDLGGASVSGDGTLARFLRAEQVDVIATDDHSWDAVVDYPQDVLPETAARTLSRRRPAVVVCSWPPPGNHFERVVFDTPSVELYIVIGSRHEAAAGNWDTYRHQTTFEMTTDERLSRLTLPPENHGAVHVFRRRTD
jgi:hypothetical protein